MRTVNFSGRDWGEINSSLNKRSQELLAEVRAHQATARKEEAVKGASFIDSPDIGEEGTVWRRLTTVPGRELVPILQDRMIQICYWLFESNPLARWLIDLTVAFIVAEGLPYEAKNPDVKSVLDGFWNDPVNRMPLYFPKHMSELHIFGELMFPAFTAPQTGRMRYGYLDPAQIFDVITDPENAKTVIGVITKGWIGEVAGYSLSTNVKHYRTILGEESEATLSAIAREIRDIFADGECFYRSINNVSNSPRGRSSLLTVADWLDAYEQFLYDYVEKWPQQNSFVWDLKVEGADDAEIKKQMKAFTKKSGSAFGHNEKVTMTAVNPKLEAVDAGEGARLIRNHIMGKFGFPEHWYGGGGKVNRATAAEMDTPAIKILTWRQLEAKYIIEDLLNEQIRRARIAGYLRCTDEEARDWSTQLPPLDTKDVSKLGTMVQAVATSLATAEIQGWIDKDTARQIYVASVDFLGVDIDLEEVKNALDEAEKKVGYEDYLKKNPGKPGLNVVQQ